MSNPPDLRTPMSDGEGAARPLVILGRGGHGRVIADMARAAGREVAGFLDDAPDSPGRTAGPPVLGRTERVGESAFVLDHEFIVGIGDGALRRSLSERILSAGGTLSTIVHPSAVVAPDVEIGCGTVIVAGAIISTGAKLGRFVVINTGATVDHDNIVGDCVHISPGCHLAGWVVCGADAFLGTGVNVIPRVRIGKGSYVAAGATVIEDVGAGCLVAGCPAVFKKRLIAE